jgi:pectinesterase
MRRRCLPLAAGWLLAGCVEYGSPIAEPPPEPDVATRPASSLGLPVFMPYVPPGSEPAKGAAPTAPAAEGVAAAGPLNATDAPSSVSQPVPAQEEAAPPLPEPLAPPSGTPPPDLPLLGTSARPELDPLVADALEILDYLALAGDLSAGLRRDDWDPTAGGGDVLARSADYRVAPNGGTHTSVQAAINTVVAAGGSDRRLIELTPGTYREFVCVPSGAPPITLYGTELDASRTVIAFDNYSGKPKPAGTAANPCNPNSAATTFGTSGSATLAVLARDFIAQNLSIVNDTQEDEATGSVQAPALLSQGDRALYDNVRVLGNQDTLLAKSPDVDTVTRAYFKSCFVEGDTDFILGRGTLVLDGCTFHSLTARLTGSVFAPSTDARNPFGMLVTKGTFTADAEAEPASIQLGRAWDESQSSLANYAELVASGAYPNGQLLVRESLLGAQVDGAAPWRSASPNARPYDSAGGAYPANRLYEYANAGPGSASGAENTLP